MTYETTTDSENLTVEVTPEMIRAALQVFREWQESAEPDDRVMMRAALEAALAARGSSSRP